MKKVAILPSQLTPSGSNQCNLSFSKSLLIVIESGDEMLDQDFRSKLEDLSSSGTLETLSIENLLLPARVINIFGRMGNALPIFHAHPDR